MGKDLFKEISLQHFGDGDVVFGDADSIDLDGIVKPDGTQSTVDEIMFGVAGEDGNEQQLPYGKLTPDQRKAVFEAYTNKSKWQASNTQAAQKLAAERETFDGERDTYKTSLGQLDTWTNYFNEHQDLQSIVSAYVAGKIPQNVMQQLIGQQAGAQVQGGQNMNQNISQNTNADYRDPLVAKLLKQVEELNGRITKGDNTRQEEKEETDKITALKALAEANPNFDKENFLKYLDKTADEMGDKSKLFGLVYKAMQHEAGTNQQASKGARVEKGTGDSAVNTPENVDTKDKSMDDLFDEFADEHGVEYA